MNLPPQARNAPRPTRVRPAEFTPAVLRIQDGSCTPGELSLYSLTGGLLSLKKPLHDGSRVKLVFLTSKGPVLGEAEMLKPVSWTEQPFRFVSLNETDQRRLQAATQPVGNAGQAAAAAPALAPRVAEPTEAAPSPARAPLVMKSFLPLDREQMWIEKYRAALMRNESPRKRLSRLVFTTLTLGSIAAGAAYAFQSYLWRLAGMMPSVFGR
ncbi:MAG TPA: hypothetical protein VLV49_05630 [Terriglobales bacterium]|nr:hypothetical protein [Terriglobales bacterium]